MRLAVAHNFYSSDVPSGENTVVVDDVRLLRQAGLEIVELFKRSNALISLRSKASALRSTLGDASDAQSTVRALSDQGVELLHVHQLSPMLPAGLVSEARRAGIPVVRTIHNFRMTCVAGTHFRDGQECFDCLGKAGLPGVRHRCYRNSLGQSAIVTLSRRRHPGAYHDVNVHIALTVAMKRYLEAQGLAPERVVVRPNPVTPPDGLPRARGDRNGFLYLGRLDEAKGILQLLREWPRDAPRLLVAGGGPQYEDVRDRSGRTPNVTFLGPVDAHRAGELVSEAIGLLVPSRWAEGYPRVIAEAFARGTPVLATDVGGLRDIVGNAGWILSQIDGQSISDALRAAASGHKWQFAADAAYANYLRELTPEAGLAGLLAVYSGLLSPRTGS